MLTPEQEKGLKDSVEASIVVFHQFLAGTPLADVEDPEQQALWREIDNLHRMNIGFLGQLQARSVIDAAEAAAKK